MSKLATGAHMGLGERSNFVIFNNKRNPQCSIIFNTQVHYCTKPTPTIHIYTYIEIGYKVISEKASIRPMQITNMPFQNEKQNINKSLKFPQIYE